MDWWSSPWISPSIGPVSADARARAEDWAKYFVATIPEFDELVSSGQLTERQRAVVSTAMVGNVFRFKLYDAKGNAVLQSDLETFSNQEQHDHIDDEAMDVIASKQPLVSLKAGTRERNMPTLYAEAYVPVLDMRAICAPLPRPMSTRREQERSTTSP